MDQIGSLLIPFGSLAAIVWGATTFLPKAIPWLKRFKKDFLALVLGPFLGIVAQLAVLVNAGEGWKGYLGAFFMGFGATVLAGIVHDKAVRPAIPKKGP